MNAGEQARHDPESFYQIGAPLLPADADPSAGFQGQEQMEYEQWLDDLNSTTTD